MIARSPAAADTNTKRETGRKAQLNNIAAAKVRPRLTRRPFAPQPRLRISPVDLLDGAE